jgi:hypothetical protein
MPKRTMTTYVLIHEFMRRVVRDRLAITPDEMDGGHMVALSRPRELADRPEAFTAASSGRA